MRIRLLLPLLLVALALLVGCKGSDATSFEDSKFIGSWYLDPADKPGTPGYYLDVLASGVVNFSWPEGNVVATGTCELTGDNLTGSWHNFAGLTGTLVGILTDDNHMTFDFVENKPSGILHVPYNATRR